LTTVVDMRNCYVRRRTSLLVTIAATETWRNWHSYFIEYWYIGVSV